MFYHWIIFGILLFFPNSLICSEECQQFQQLTASSYYTYLTFPSSDSDSESKYENNQSCSWLIFSGGKDLSLEIQWLWVDIEFTVGCSADYVQIYRGMNRETGELLDHRCGKSTSAIQNIGRYGLVYFSSNNETVGSGFKFRYRSKSGMTSCKSPESLTAHPYQWQVFTSPYYPKPYVSNLACHWVITAADSDNIVQMEFEDFDVELSDNCTKDYLQVHDGGSKDSPLIGIYCGQDFPAVKSTGRKIYISLYSDDKGQNIGFKAKYIATQTGPQCGGITNLVAVRNKKKYLLSPNYPHFYGSNLSCSWLIQSGSIGRPMYLDVVDSDIEYSEGCQKDYVEIYLGLSRDAPIFSRWCGGTRRKFYTYNFYNYLFVHFHTDSAFSGRGFQLSYYLVQTDSVCAEPISVGVVRNSWHELTSPYYPTVYEGNVTCIWKISAQHHDDLIEMEVVESEIEESIGCIYDYVTIYDGDNKESTILGRWCGKDTPHFFSNGANLLIEFFTDNSYEYKGFKIRLRSVPRRNVCGSVVYFAVKGEVQYFSSPTTLSPLYRSVTCSWLIITNPGDIVKIEVIYSAAGKSPACNNTYFKVFDGLTKEGHLLGFSCGNSTPTYISTKEHIRIVLTSSNDSNGFFISYTALAKGQKCKDIYELKSVRNQKQYFATPDFSTSAKGSTSCSWRIRASVPGDIIQLRIVYADIFSRPGCKDAHVEVFDGPDESSPSLGKFCGIDEPSFFSRSGEMFMKLQGIIQGATRFTAVYYSEPVDAGKICPDGIIQLNATTTVQFFNITSNSLAESSKLCHWQIIGSTENHTIVLQFLLSNFGQKSSDCETEYIAVHEDQSLSNPIQKFCQDETQTIRSQTNALHVLALSNSSRFSFMAKFQLISDPDLNYEASKSATKQKRFFSSPDFFNQSESAMFVHWVIKAAEKKEKVIFELAFSGIPRTYNCDMASITVYDSESESSADTLLGKFCGPDGVTLTSTGDHLLVKYNTKEMSESRGFMAAYYTKKIEPPKSDTTQHQFYAVCIVLVVIGALVLVSWLLWRWRRNMQFKFVRIRHWPEEDND